MIAFPRTPVPVPNAVADLAASHLPQHVRDAVGEAALAGRLLTARTLAVCPRDVRFEAGAALQVRLTAANKVLAAYNPRLIHGWSDLPGLCQKETR